jgi:hypothetical protein
MRLTRPSPERLSLRLRQTLKKVSDAGSKTADLRFRFRFADALQSIATELNPKGSGNISLENLRLGLLFEIRLNLAFRLSPS